jgi:hypothetical protein
MIGHIWEQCGGETPGELSKTFFWQRHPTTIEKNMSKKLGPKIARNAIFLVINPTTVILNEF